MPHNLSACSMFYSPKLCTQWLKSVVVMHWEMWYALSAIMNNKRYAEYINNVPLSETGGVNMDTALDYFIAEGEARGEAKGEMKGEAKVNKLGILLTEMGRTADFLKSLSDPVFQRKLFMEFGLEEEK